MTVARSPKPLELIPIAQNISIITQAQNLGNMHREIRGCMNVHTYHDQNWNKNYPH